MLPEISGDASSSSCWKSVSSEIAAAFIGSQGRQGMIRPSGHRSGKQDDIVPHGASYKTSWAHAAGARRRTA